MGIPTSLISKTVFFGRNQHQLSLLDKRRFEHIMTALYPGIGYISNHIIKAFIPPQVESLVLSNFKRNYKTQLKKDFNNLWPMLEESLRRLEEGIQQGITWNNLPSRVFAGRRRLRDEYKFYDFYEHMMSEL